MGSHYSPYHSGGLKNVRHDTGRYNYAKATIHDFESNGGHGGKRILIQGDLGTGKTTLNLQSILKFGYLTTTTTVGFLKGDSDTIYPETIVYRGRKKDYWNIFLPENFKKAFGTDEVRPLRVFIYDTDDLTFYEQKSIGENIRVLEPNIYRYLDIEDLYKNLIIGGINIVYPPNDYILSPLLKKRINDLMMKSKEGRKYLAENKDISVPSVAFWYDVIYFFISDVEEVKARAPEIEIIKSVVFVFDEAHQIFPAGAAKPFWYLVDNFAEDEIIETRRINLSIWADIHDYRFMYWKILGRFNYFIFLKGAKSMYKSKISRIVQPLIDALPIGKFLIEEKSGFFGDSDFNRIENQPIALTVKGMK
jgi:hypothetical protein